MEFKLVIKNSQTENNIFSLSFCDVWNAWRVIAITMFFGVSLGILYWYFAANVVAEYRLFINRPPSEINSNPNISDWKFLQHNLYSLASQQIDENLIPPNQVVLYQYMSSEGWWKKNVIPFYALSKNDLKEVPGANKTLDPSDLNLMGLVIIGRGKNSSSAIEGAMNTAAFIRSGGSFLQIKKLLINYGLEIEANESQIQKKLVENKIEESYLRERYKHLESLNKKYPTLTLTSSHIIDTKEGSAKYLPLQTQIIGVSREIAMLGESNLRLTNRLQQLKVLNIFLQESKIYLDNKNCDGLLLISNLLQIETILRSKFDKDDVISLEVLSDIKLKLHSIRATFSSGLEASTAPTIKSSGLVIYILIGAGLGFLLAALFILSRKLLAIGSISRILNYNWISR